MGQEWDYRREMALDIVTSQLTPAGGAPLMFLLLIVLLSRELAPLKQLTRTLRLRAPDSAESLNVDKVPSEVRPLVDALNQLFARTHDTMIRERRFTSDAAHELRSPLAALKVQTEVAQLSIDDPQGREKALAQLHEGIDRATRLVDQLLTLSRLDSLAQLDDVHTIAIDELLQSSVMEMYHSAQQAGIELRLHLNATQVMQRPAALLSLLVRNLLDNAVRYSPPGSRSISLLMHVSFPYAIMARASAPKRWRGSANDSIALPVRMSPVAGWDYLSSAALPRCTG